MLKMLFHQGLDDGLGIQSLQIRVGLPRTDKHNGLAGNICHRYGGSNLVINRIKFGEDYAIDQMRVLLLRVISEGRIEFHQLVNGFVAHQGLAHKQY